MGYCNNLSLGDELWYLALSCLYGTPSEDFVSMLPLSFEMSVLGEPVTPVSLYQGRDQSFSCGVFPCRSPRGGLTQRRSSRNVPTNVWCCCRAKPLTSSKPGSSSAMCHGKVTATFRSMSQQQNCAFPHLYVWAHALVFLWKSLPCCWEKLKANTTKELGCLWSVVSWVLVWWLGREMENAFGDLLCPLVNICH